MGVAVVVAMVTVTLMVAVLRSPVVFLVPTVALGRKAWRLDDVRDHLDRITLKGWVGEGNEADTLIQDSTLGALLTPDYWLEVLSERGLNQPGTVLISGTVAMTGGVDQFARSWRVEMADPVTGSSIEAAYIVEQMAEPIG